MPATAIDNPTLHNRSNEYVERLARAVSRLTRVADELGGRQEEKDRNEQPTLVIRSVHDKLNEIARLICALENQTSRLEDYTGDDSANQAQLKQQHAEREIANAGGRTAAGTGYIR